jgi:hypothetical protein
VNPTSLGRLICLSWSLYRLKIQSGKMCSRLGMWRAADGDARTFRRDGIPVAGRARLWKRRGGACPASGGASGKAMGIVAAVRKILKRGVERKAIEGLQFFDR